MKFMVPAFLILFLVSNATAFDHANSLSEFRNLLSSNGLNIAFSDYPDSRIVAIEELEEKNYYNLKNDQRICVLAIPVRVKRIAKRTKCLEYERPKCTSKRCPRPRKPPIVPKIRKCLKWAPPVTYYETHYKFSEAHKCEK